MFNEKVDVASLTECRVVVDSYVNGNSWYRIYSDGWVEQGGYTTSSNVTLLKEMANINYTINMAQLGQTSAYAAQPLYATTTGFQYYQYQSIYNAYWEVRGMGA